VFKNRGDRAGASMTHSHSQILALPVITHNTEDELRGAKEYYDTHGEHCIFCDIVAHETVSKIRIIDENEQFITLSPYAPRFPYEVWLIPKRHSSNYESVDEDEVSSKKIIIQTKSLLTPRFL
jgi:UDPglucose--hexose-1-phosphate uridylyltransferase